MPEYFIDIKTYVSKEYLSKEVITIMLNKRAGWDARKREDIGGFKETKNIGTELKYASEAINSKDRSLYFHFVSFYVFQIFYDIHVFLL